ncbi:MAG: glycosyltransferase family 2 protein [Candidatus Alcyoniella australis]|nr:glycosyltransferase family 2 protein [Candidatus Alcyoniella australis]
MKISAVVCAHNEQDSIEDVLHKLARLGSLYELIVVDDGSIDSTAQIAEGAGAQVLALRPNQGKGRAIAAGIKAARGDWVLFIDGDGQDHPRDVPKLIQAATDGADLVNGSKFIGSIERGAISGPNYWGNRLMSGLINLLFGARISDSQSGFRLIRAKFLKALQLRSAQYEIETEILISALKQGLRVVEVPVLRSPRSAGRTDFRRIRNGLRILWTILRLRMRRDR